MRWLCDIWGTTKMLLHLVHDAKLGRNHRWFHCFGDEDGMNWLKRYFAVDLFLIFCIYFFDLTIPSGLRLLSVHVWSQDFAGVPKIGALQLQIKRIGF